MNVFFFYVPKIYILIFKADAVLQVPIPEILLQHYFTDEFRFTLGVGYGLQRMPEFRRVYPSGVVFHSSWSFHILLQSRDETGGVRAHLADPFGGRGMKETVPGSLDILVN